MIEEAAELPRIYLYAPKTEALYPSQGLRLAARKKQFEDIDKTKKGHVTANEWIRFAIGHIETKFTQLPKDYLSGSAIGVSKEEFIEFIKKAVDPSSKEYEELYYFLLRTFQAGDKGGYGEVQPAEFDEIIECAAAAPRNFGLAPASEDIFDNIDVSKVQKCDTQLGDGHSSGTCRAVSERQTLAGWSAYFYPLSTGLESHLSASVS